MRDGPPDRSDGPLLTPPVRLAPLAALALLAACTPHLAPAYTPTVEGVERAEAPTAATDRAEYAPGDTVRLAVENLTGTAVGVALGSGRIERPAAGSGGPTCAPRSPAPSGPVWVAGEIGDPSEETPDE